MTYDTVMTQLCPLMKGQAGETPRHSSGLRHPSFHVTTVAAASLLIASRGGASPQTFEKRALTIFRLEPDPHESAHQLDCSLLLPTAMANRVVSTQKILC